MWLRVSFDICFLVPLCCAYCRVPTVCVLFGRHTRVCAEQQQQSLLRSRTAGESALAPVLLLVTDQSVATTVGFAVAALPFGDALSFALASTEVPEGCALPVPVVVRVAFASGTASVVVGSVASGVVALALGGVVGIDPDAVAILLATGPGGVAKIGGTEFVGTAIARMGLGGTTVDIGTGLFDLPKLDGHCRFDRSALVLETSHTPLPGLVLEPVRQFPIEIILHLVNDSGKVQIGLLLRLQLPELSSSSSIFIVRRTHITLANRPKQIDSKDSCQPTVVVVVPVSSILYSRTDIGFGRKNVGVEAIIVAHTPLAFQHEFVKLLLQDLTNHGEIAGAAPCFLFRNEIEQDIVKAFVRTRVARAGFQTTVIIRLPLLVLMITSCF